MADVLSNEQVDEAMQQLPGWELSDGVIKRAVTAPTFLAGIGLVDEVAQAAETAGHHPDIDIRWTTVTFALVTHAVGALTQNDFDLAHEINSIVAARI